MTISRRALIASGFLSFATLITPTLSFADGSGSGKASFQDLSVVASPSGEGAPDPFEVRFSEGGLDRLTENVSANEFVEIIANEISIAMSGLKLGPIKGMSPDRIFGRDGIKPGEYVIPMMSENPDWKWEIAVRIKG